jgi:hypothetical protein
MMLCEQASRRICCPRLRLSLSMCVLNEVIHPSTHPPPTYSPSHQRAWTGVSVATRPLGSASSWGWTASGHKSFSMKPLLGRAPLRHAFCVMTESRSDKAVAPRLGVGAAGAFQDGHALVLTQHPSPPSHHHDTHSTQGKRHLRLFLSSSAWRAAAAAAPKVPRPYFVAPSRPWPSLPA